MSMPRLKTLISGAAVAAIALCIPLQAGAQEDDDRVWTEVRTIHVKPGRNQEHVALQKQFAEAAAAAGMPRTVWQEVRGDTNTFHVVRRIDNLAEFDTPFEPPMDEDAWQEWIAAFTKNIDTMTLNIYRRHADWGIPAEEDATPNLLVLRTLTLAPGNMGPFHGWIQDQLIPALKEGGATGVNFSHLAFGGETNTWIIASMLDSWADLDVRRGSLAYMSDEDYAALFAPNADRVWGNDVKILRYRADLSN